MSDSLPDVKLLAREELPQGVFPARGGEDLRVVFAAPAHDQAWQHATANKSVEICGVLVGGWRRDADGPFVEIEHIIPSDAAKSGMAEVTFTHEAWGKINQEMDTRYSDKRIVGWYHSHPDFGIFLSDRDVFIHQHFFSGPGQIALVVDPVRRLEGVFCWRSGKTALMSHYWVGSKLLIRPAESAGEGDGKPLTLPAVGLTPAESGSGRANVAQWSALLPVILVTLLATLLGYWLGAWRDAQERQLLHEAIVMRFFNSRILRVGLEEETENARKDLARLAKRLAALAPRGEKGETGKSEHEAEWKGVGADLALLKQTVDQIQQRYALSRDEQTTLIRETLAARQQAEREAANDKRRDQQNDAPEAAAERNRAQGKSTGKNGKPKPADEGKPAAPQGRSDPDTSPTKTDQNL